MKAVPGIRDVITPNFMYGSFTPYLRTYFPCGSLAGLSAWVMPSEPDSVRGMSFHSEAGGHTLSHLFGDCRKCFPLRIDFDDWPESFDFRFDLVLDWTFTKKSVNFSIRIFPTEADVPPP
jgi:hypothetical protein